MKSSYLVQDIHCPHPLISISGSWTHGTVFSFKDTAPLRVSWTSPIWALKCIPGLILRLRVVIYFLNVATFLLHLSGPLLFQLLIFYILSNYFAGLYDREWWQVCFCIDTNEKKREIDATVLYPFVQTTKKSWWRVFCLPHTADNRSTEMQLMAAQFYS